MLAVTLALLAAAPGADCQIDRSLPDEFAKWRYARVSIDNRNSQLLSVEGTGGPTDLDFRALPPVSGWGTTEFFRVSKAGGYAFAAGADVPLVVYGDARDADGKRIAVAPVARRAGPACTSIAAINFYQLPPGNYYARAEQISGPIRTLVTRID